MAVIYATLIVDGHKTFPQVPTPLREQVREVLTSLGCAALAQ